MWGGEANSPRYPILCLVLVFTGPLDIKTRAEKAKPALTEFHWKPNVLDITCNTLNIVCYIAKCKRSAVFNSIACSRISVSRLTNRWDANISAPVYDSVDLAVGMTAENNRMLNSLKVVRQNRVWHLWVQVWSFCRVMHRLYGKPKGFNA